MFQDLYLKMKYTILVWQYSSSTGEYLGYFPYIRSYLDFMKNYRSDEYEKELKKYNDIFTKWYELFEALEKASTKEKENE